MLHKKNSSPFTNNSHEKSIDFSVCECGNVCRQINRIKCIFVWVKSTSYFCAWSFSLQTNLRVWRNLSKFNYLFILFWFNSTVIWLPDDSFKCFWRALYFKWSRSSWSSLTTAFKESRCKTAKGKHKFQSVVHLFRHVYSTGLKNHVDNKPSKSFAFATFSTESFKNIIFPKLIRLGWLRDTINGALQNAKSFTHVYHIWQPPVSSSPKIYSTREAWK